MRKQPKLWVFAGPNGAGKSTLIKRFISGGLEIVNPDILVVKQSILPIEAARQALQRRFELLSLGKSFAIETTMSGMSELKFIAAAKNQGFKVILFFVYIASPILALQRIAEREYGAASMTCQQKMLGAASSEAWSIYPALLI
ncbi:MAG: hypothetical protein QWI73_04845 [Alphaproteobacteria bacterium]|nr:hypothetical protein [Alphaproteobacteria bacterium]